MIFRTFPVGVLQCNCVILGCEKTKEALVIDPGDEVDRILGALRDENLILRGIVHTHAHLDHLGATVPLAQATGAPIYLHADDLPLYEHVPEQAALFGFPAPPVAPADRYIRDGESLSWGTVSAEVMHTPGHTPGSVCLRVPWLGGQSGGVAQPERVFAGDTLFAGSIGRTDLWGGDFDRILASIRDRLLSLPDDTIVWPGHGPATTIGRERRENPFLAR
jgi:glyoxylase-like metal-dependent hydrolase (beta-lactamase superfamily II)